MAAAKEGHASVCALLIRAKAHDFHRCEKSALALDYCALLIRAKAHNFHRCEKSASALDLAVRHGHTAVAAQLQRVH